MKTVLDRSMIKHKITRWNHKHLAILTFLSLFLKKEKKNNIRMNVTQDKNIDYASKKAFSLDVVRAVILTERTNERTNDLQYIENLIIIITYFRIPII